MVCSACFTWDRPACPGACRSAAPGTPAPDSWKCTPPVESGRPEQLESSLRREVASAGRNFHLPKGKCETRGGQEAEALGRAHCVQWDPTPSNAAAPHSLLT